MSAANLIAEHGYLGAGMADIVLRSGMTRGAVYFHFDSKAGLAAALVDRARQDWEDAIGLVGRRRVQGLTALEVLFNTLGERLVRDPVSRAAVRMEGIEEVQQLSGPSPVDALRDHVAVGLRQGRLAGALRDDLDPRTLAEILVASFLGLHQHNARGAGSAGGTSRSTTTRFRSAAASRLAVWWNVTERGLLKR